MKQQCPVCEFKKSHNLNDYLLNSCKIVNNAQHAQKIIKQLEQFGANSCTDDIKIYSEIVEILIEYLSQVDNNIRKGSIFMIGTIAFTLTDKLNVHEIFTLFIRMLLQNSELDCEITLQVYIYTFRNRNAISNVSHLLLMIVDKCITKYKEFAKDKWGNRWNDNYKEPEVKICANVSHILAILLETEKYPKESMKKFLGLVLDNLNDLGFATFFKLQNPVGIEMFSREGIKTSIVYSEFLINFSKKYGFRDVWEQWGREIIINQYKYSAQLYLLFQPDLTNIEMFEELLSLTECSDCEILSEILLDISLLHYKNDRSLDLLSACFKKFSTSHKFSNRFIDFLNLSFDGDLVILHRITFNSKYFAETVVPFVHQHMNEGTFLSTLSILKFLNLLLADFHYFMTIDGFYDDIFLLLTRCIRDFGFEKLESKQLLYQQVLLNIGEFVKFKSLLSLSKSQLDEMVACMDLALLKWPSIAKTTIYIIDIMTHELQESMCRFLPSILDKFVQVVGHLNISVHILEMLSSLSNVGNVYKNCTENDFKTIFGIAIQYITSAKFESNSYKQYHLYLAFHVIDTWILHVRDIDEHFKFLVQKLIMANNMNSFVKERVMICLDYISRLYLGCKTTPYSDLEKPSTAYSFGNCLITTEGENIVIRRPSGTTYHHPDDGLIGKSLPIVDASRSKSNGSIFSRKPSMKLRRSSSASSDHCLIQDLLHGFPLQCFHNEVRILGNFVFTSSAANILCEKDLIITSLPISEKLLRNVNVLDHTPVVDFHKFGIYCIKETQSEAEILSNIEMSSDFLDIYKGFGDVVEIESKHYKYWGGLSKENDGTETVIWQDAITYIVFLNSCFMPNHDSDPSRNMKKRHLGNCFVNIVFKEANSKLSLIQSQQVSVAIIIEPWTHSNMFKVYQILRKNLSYIGPLTTPKIIHKDNVSKFVRQIALHANIYAQINSNTQGNSEYISDWRQRLRILQKI
eukprot:NODE_142_length_15935_cov_1.439126.p1 type:complete len:972 gc:universal NODE_142_length_15935_cov_1.439126:2893-5808(+)